MTDKIVEKHELFECEIMLDEEEAKQHRTVYGILDLLGDVGGIMDILIIIFGVFLFPLSHHSFLDTATKKFFYARTKDDKDFGKVADSENFPNDKKIKISFC
mgnify:CR=1 FL=1